MLLLFFEQPVPAFASFVSGADVLEDVWPALNASGPADAIFWTEDELYAWFDEAAKRLARKTGLFVRRDGSLSSSASTGDYSLPSDHVVTIQADLDGSVLRPRNVQEIEALDGNWPTRSGAPKAFLEDSQGVNRLTLYPGPDAGHANLTIGLVERYTPDQVSKAAAIVPISPIMREYFTFYAIAEARGTKETNASMPEVSQWCAQLCGMYEQAAMQYWGDL